jgi:hypothetical protein
MLYANGCSFTAGTGLEDEEKAWPYILGENMGIDKENILTEAHKGVSNQYIIRSTISTVSKILSETENRPFCAIGLTAPSRREYFHPKSNQLIHKIPSPEFTPIDGLDETTNVELNVFNALYMKYFWSPVYDFHLYMTHVLTMQNFFKQNDLDYVIFNSLNLTTNLVEETKFKELCEQAGMKHIFKQFDMDRIYEDQTFFTYMYDKELYFKEEGTEAFMHPNEEAHEGWANILMKDITATMMKQRMKR